ncbi:uncharacterized protein LOC117297717 [Asterias rubens]|uniref:uncharacterized protein LOC117297717 n=1 Tax=Asterias rubens TaxID=7604 RepID=UPI001455D913|nr:uncharacterized protein LOC117297717 [Asterias rubens]
MMSTVLLRALQGARRASPPIQSKLYQCDDLRSRSRSCLASMVLSKHLESSGFSTGAARMRKHVIYFACLSRRPGQINCLPGLVQGTSSILENVNVSSFHTSSSLNGFFSRHQQGFREVPRPALALGIVGLVPFVVPAVYTAATSTIGLDILWAQVAYGASILSFLGGVRWGFALTEGQGPTWSTLSYSVIPSLIAWLGLLMPLQSSQLCVMTGLLMAWAVDANTKVYPAWFKSLRLILSLGALISLGVTFGYSPISAGHRSNLIKLVKIVQIILEE